MAQATCRVTPALQDAIEGAAEEAGLFRSDVIRRALVYYVNRNPDELEALAGCDLRGVRSVGSGEKSRNRSETSADRPGVYDPVGDR